MTTPNIRNTKFNQQIADDILDLVSKGVTRPTRIALAIGVTYKTFSGWLLKSNRGDPAFLIDFNDEQVQLARAFALSKRLAYLELRGLVEQTSIYGREETLYKDGQVVWALDPKAAAIADEDIRELLGYRRDALLEIDGALQPVKAHRDAPFAMQIRVLEAAFKDLRPSSVQEVNVNGAVAIGVQHVAKPDFSGEAPAIPPMPAMPQLEVLDDVVEADFADAVDDAEQITPPTPSPISIVIAPVIAQPEPEPSVGTFVPTPTNEPPSRSMSPMEADLWRRLKGSPEERSKPLGASQ